MAHSSEYHSGISNKGGKKEGSKPMAAVDIVTPAIPVPSEFALPKGLSPPASGSKQWACPVTLMKRVHADSGHKSAARA